MGEEGRTLTPTKNRPLSARNRPMSARSNRPKSSMGKKDSEAGDIEKWKISNKCEYNLYDSHGKYFIFIFIDISSTIMPDSLEYSNGCYIYLEIILRKIYLIMKYILHKINKNIKMKFSYHALRKAELTFKNMDVKLME